MPSRNSELLERAHQVAPLLQAIEVASGLPAHQMRVELVNRIPTASAGSMKRNWNRWLAGATHGGSLPTVMALVEIVNAARSLGWLAKPMSAEARSLARWLESRALSQRVEMQETAAKALTAFIDELLHDVDFRQYDVEAAIESMFSTFSEGIARHVARQAGEQGLSEAVSRGAVRALDAMHSTLSALVEALDESELAPVAVEVDLHSSAVPSRQDARRAASDAEAESEPKGPATGKLLGAKRTR